MRRKTMVFLGVLAVLAGCLGWWIGRGRDPGSEAARQGPTPSERRRALVAQKMESRPDGPQDPVVVTGRVVGAEDGRAIAAAVVLLTPKSFEQGAASVAGDSPLPMVARSDAGGGWVFEDVRPGRYMLSATAAAFLPGLRTDVVVGASGASGLELALTPGGHPISGTVADIGGGGIEGAIVQVVRLDDGNLLRFDRAPVAVLTDAEGHYRAHVPDGAFFVSATHADYVTVQRSVMVDDSPARQDFELVPAAVVEGVVRRRDSRAPVPGAIVVANAENVMAATGGMQIRGVGQHRVVADARGHFRLRGLPAGVFELSASGPGAATRQATSVSVGIAASRDDVEVLVDGAYSIRGFAVDRADPQRGLEGVWIGAFSLQPPALVAATQPTEVDGYFEIVGVDPGHYVVAAIGESALPNLMGTSATIEDHDVEDVLVEMDMGVAIRGRVEPAAVAEITLEVDMQGAGLGGALTAMSNAFVRGRSDPTGDFVLRPVADGKVTIVAKAEDGRRGELEVEVGPEGLADVVVSLEEKAHVRGRVIDADGNAVAEARVTLTELGGRRGKMALSIGDNPMFGGGVPTRSDGTFEVRGLEPGRYEVRVNADRGPALAWAEPTDPEHPTAPRVIEVGASGVDGLDLAVENADGTITGVVVDEDGQAVADAWVTASQEGASSRLLQEFVRDRQREAGTATIEAEVPEERDATATRGRGAEPTTHAVFSAQVAEDPVLTDAEGRFTIRGLREGTYALEAELAGRDLRVRIGGVALGGDVRLVLDPLAGIDGIVTAGGERIDEFTLRLQGPRPTVRSVYDPQGRFHLDRLDPGTHTLHVEADAGAADVEVDVESGARTSIEVELEPYGILRGRVLAQGSGEPIAGMVVVAKPAEGDVGVSAGLSLLTGGGPRTDARGRFELPRIQAGKGRVIVFDTDASGQVASVDYAVGVGEALDLGTIEGIEAGAVPAAERGELGLETIVRPFATRPRVPSILAGDDRIEDEDEVPADPDRARLWVRSITVGGPAHRAGLRPGDEVLAIDGRDVVGLGAQVAGQLLRPHRLRVGDTIGVLFERGGSEDRVTLEATARASGH